MTTWSDTAVHDVALANRQTESDAHHPTLHGALVGSKSCFKTFVSVKPAKAFLSITTIARMQQQLCIEFQNTKVTCVGSKAFIYTIIRDIVKM